MGPRIELRQNFSLIEQAALGAELLGAGTKQAVPGQGGLLKHADDVFMSLQAHGRQAGLIGLLCGFLTGRLSG
ncbi:hypothetical protein RA876_10460 [Rhodoferax antarcticus]|nr:hypothetical protein RA876_10395 [Rhodoferax antarcticus]APW46715.1 hypothetical protein RA876_10460 [Rhodoferax antarcticus]